MGIPRWSDGAGVGVVLDNNVLGGIAVTHIFEIADAATADYDIVLTNKTEIIDCVVHKKGGTGIAVTATLKNGSTALTDAMSLNVAIKLIVRPLQMDDASNVINAGGILRVSIARTTGNAACRVYVYGVKRA